MKHSESITKISAALLKAQKKMGAAPKDTKNPFFKSKYADLGSVMEVAKDPLNEEGITILQPPTFSEGMHMVETILLHESGEWISSMIKLELSKNDMQNLGSCITYARRQNLQSLLSIPAEDDDGNSAVSKSPVPALTPAQTKPVSVGSPAPTSAGITQQSSFKQFKNNGVF